MVNSRATAMARFPLHVRILAGFVTGAVLGIAAHALFPEHPRVEWLVANLTEPLGKLFLRLLILTIVPLIFSSLVLGVVGLGDLRKLGRVGIKTLVYTLVVSSISVVIGFGMANLVKPGARLEEETRASLMERYQSQALDVAKKATKEKKAPLMSVVEIVPENPLASASKNPPDMLGIMFFSLFFGVALALIPFEKGRPLVGALEAVYEAASMMIHVVMWAAPLGVAALLFSMTARFGFGLLVTLGLYVVCVIGALAIHQFVVYSAILRTLGRVSPLEFFKRVRGVMLTAFSTSSSNATLPTALKATEEQLHVPRDIGSFVLTVGATANQNGTALFEGVTILFLAQVFGVELTVGQQLSVLVLAVVSGIGTAGVPSGSLPFIAVILGTIGIPVEGLAIIIGVDRLLDMCRTVLNVTGDLACAVVIAKSEGVEVMKPLSDPV